MPTPPATSSTSRRVRRSAVIAPYGPSASDPGAGLELLQPAAAVAERLDGEPQVGAAGRGRQRERVRGLPQVGGQEAPAEELARLAPAARAGRGPRRRSTRRPGPRRRTVGDPHPVAARGAQRRQDAVHEHEREHAGVEQRPQHLQHPVPGEVGPGELVHERQRDGDVDEQVRARARPRTTARAGRPARTARPRAGAARCRRWRRPGRAGAGRARRRARRSRRGCAPRRPWRPRRAPARAPTTARPPAPCQRESRSAPTPRSSAGARDISATRTTTP